MVKRFLEYIRGVIDKMLSKDALSRQVGGKILLSSDMADAIDLWFDMFRGRAPWITNKAKGIGLAGLSTAYLARLINAEIKLEVAGSPRAEYINTCMQDMFLPRITEATQLALIGGEVVYKPYCVNGRMGIEFIRADRFYPMEIDGMGTVRAAAFVERKRENTTCYTRLETHRLSGTTYTITNKAFRGDGSALGSEIALSDYSAWQDIAPEVTIEHVERPLFACFRMPFANAIDMDSNLPVSIYANAVETMADIDRVYTDYCWEFQSARRRVYVDSTAFEFGKDGKPRYPDADLYIGLETNGQNAKLFEDYTPDIREQNYQNGINQLLRIYEAQTGVSAGTYSLDMKTGAVTATQVISEDRATFYTVAAIQECQKAAILHLAYIIHVFATLYGLAPDGEYEVIAEFGDSVFEDTQSEFNRRIQLVSQGILRPEELRAWYLGEDEETARKNLPEMTQVLDA